MSLLDRAEAIADRIPHDDEAVPNERVRMAAFTRIVAFPDDSDDEIAFAVEYTLTMLGECLAVRPLDQG